MCTDYFVEIPIRLYDVSISNSEYLVRNPVQAELPSSILQIFTKVSENADQD